MAFQPGSDSLFKAIECAAEGNLAALLAVRQAPGALAGLDLGGSCSEALVIAIAHDWRALAHVHQNDQTLALCAQALAQDRAALAQVRSFAHRFALTHAPPEVPMHALVFTEAGEVAVEGSG